MTEIFSSETKLFNLENINKNVARYKVPMCYVGIANKFDFSKEVIEGMVDTIKGSAVLTYYDEQVKDFGGHESDLYKSNGVLKRTPSLYPIGFAIYDQDAWWEIFNFDGIEREYYTTFVYLWKDRYPELQNLKQVYQSMEVEIDYENPIDGIKKVKSASFQGMAMLGSSVLPAFKGSTFIKFSSDDLNILKQEFEQTKIKPSERFKTINVNQTDINNNTPLKGGENENVFYGLTSNQLRSRLNSALSSFTYVSGEYEYRQYWVDDFRIDTVFLLDESDNKYYIINYQYVDGQCIFDMSTKVLAEETYVPITFSQKTEVFLQQDEYGSGSKLEFDLTKDSASNDDWSSVNKTNLRNQIAKSSNWKSAKSKCYIISEGDNASDWKYPVCQIKDNKLVLNVNGAQVAWSMLAKETNESYYNSAKAELKKIYKKLGLPTDTFSERSETMKDFKALYSQMKASQSSFAFDDSMDDSDSEQMTILIDSDAGCLYIMDGDGGVTKIPFVTTDNDDDTFAIKEDQKETMPNGKEMMSKMSQMFATEKEKVVTEMSAQLSAKDSEMSTQKTKMDEELMSKESDLGKSFASISSLETAMAESATVMAQKEAQIEELSKQLKGKETAEKMSQVDEVMNRKEFSVFSIEEKQTFKDKSVDMPLDKFEEMLYSTFGKKVKDNIDFSSETKKFSFMFVDNKPHISSQEDKDVYAEIREKNNNK